MTDNNQAQVNPLSNGDRRVLAKQFAGKQFNDKVVVDFCTRNKIEVVDAGSVEDMIYQEEYDTRMATVMPLILAKLAEMKYIGMFDTEEKRTEVLDFNDNLSAEIAVILENNGVEYREIGCLKEIDGNITHIMNGANTRISSMCATTLNEIALEKLGVDNLTIRALSLERSAIADRKFKAEAKPQDNLGSDGETPQTEPNVAEEGAVESPIQQDDVDADTPKADNA